MNKSILEHEVFKSSSNKTLYCGYIPLKGKAKMSKEILHSPDEVIRQYPNADGIGGVLADDVMYLDFDSHKEETRVDDERNIEIALKIIKGESLPCAVRRTTTGLHALFLDTKGITTANTSETFLASGLKAEVKARGRNNYDILVFEGVPRELAYCSQDGIGELPSCFFPVKKDGGFVGLGEGDGRNTSLYSFIPVLMGSGMNRKQIEECYDMVNRYVFEDSLTRKELDTILRDDSFPKDMFFENKRFSHNRFGDYLINALNIKKKDESIYVFNGTHYVPDRNSGYLEERMISLIPSLISSKREETKKYIRARGGIERVSGENKRYICFKNGLYDIEKDELIKHTPEVFLSNLIPHNFIWNAESELMSNALDEWCNHDSSIRMLLEETIGISFCSSTDIQKMFILYGSKSNGKSTFLKVLEKALGKENVCNLQLSEMGERFSVSRLLAKLANIGDDLSEKAIDSDALSRIKKVVTGDTIEAEFKGQDKFSFSPYATLFFSANVIPSVRDETGAFARRITIIPFDNYFSANVKETGKESKFTESDYEYFIKVGVDGLKRVMANGGNLTESSKVKDLNEKLLTHLDSVRTYISEHCGGIEGIESHVPQEIYKDYVKYCSSMYTQAVSYSSFIKEIEKRYGLTVSPRKVGEKSVRLLVKK